MTATLHDCQRGWLGDDLDDPRVPCLTCRPHLVPRGSGFVVQPRASELSERQFQQRVVDLAQLRGWRHFHAYNSQRSAPGWPDLALVRRGRLVLAELKTETGRVRPEQRLWLDDLAAVPSLEVHLWRPSDWPLVLIALA